MSTSTLSSSPSSTTATRGKRRSAWSQYRAAYLMCSPTIVLFLVFMVFPIGFVFYTSLLNWNGITSVFDAKFIGLDNYQRLIQDEFWWGPCATRCSTRSSNSWSNCRWPSCLRWR